MTKMKSCFMKCLELITDQRLGSDALSYEFQLAVPAIVLMESELHEDADEERRGWAISRRRKLIAAVVGVMMLGIVYDASKVSDNDGQSLISNVKSRVTVDEFDRIEALLANAGNQRVEGRGPTVEVPSDVSPIDERPAFDFDAFDSVMGEAVSPAAVQEPQTGLKPQEAVPPRRDSFNDLNRITELHIPEQLALGNGHRVVDTQQRSDSHPASAGRMSEPGTDHELTVGVSATQSPLVVDDSEVSTPVRIIASDVTASQITHFAPTVEQKDIGGVSSIRFTGRIFPVSRHLNQHQ